MTFHFFLFSSCYLSLVFSCPFLHLDIISSSLKFHCLFTESTQDLPKQTASTFIILVKSFYMRIPGTLLISLCMYPMLVMCLLMGFRQTRLHGVRDHICLIHNLTWFFIYSKLNKYLWKKKITIIWQVIVPVMQFVCEHNSSNIFSFSIQTIHVAFGKGKQLETMCN